MSEWKTNLMLRKRILRKGKKNLDVLIKKLIEINDEGKVELSNIAKDISNKIVYIW